MASHDNYAIHFWRQDYRVRYQQDGRRIDDDELVVLAPFGNLLGHPRGTQQVGGILWVGAGGQKVQVVMNRGAYDRRIGIFLSVRSQRSTQPLFLAHPKLILLFKRG